MDIRVHLLMEGEMPKIPRDGGLVPSLATSKNLVYS